MISKEPENQELALPPQHPSCLHRSKSFCQNLLLRSHVIPLLITPKSTNHHACQHPVVTGPSSHPDSPQNAAPPANAACHMPPDGRHGTDSRVRSQGTTDCRCVSLRHPLACEAGEKRRAIFFQSCRTHAREALQLDPPLLLTKMPKLSVEIRK